MVGYTLMAILATWRLTSLFAEEEGPWDIFVKFRFKVSGRLLGMKGASCIWCVSMYASAIITALSCALGVAPWEYAPIWWFGLSGGAIVVHTTLQRLVKS